MSLWCKSGNIKQLMNIPPEKIIILDTETTGLDEDEDEILQLAIIDGNGNLLFNEYIKPVLKKSWRKAQEIHHISPARVKNKPSFDFYKNEVKAIIQGAELLIGYNLEYDLKFLKATGIIPQAQVLQFDVMKEFAPVYGSWSNYFSEYSWTSLSECAEYYDYEFSPHNALEDCKATLHCYHSMLSDDSSDGYLTICEKCKGKSLYELHEQIKLERYTEWLLSTEARVRNVPVFDVIDDDIYSCYIVGMKSAKKIYQETPLEEADLLTSTFDSIKQKCLLNGGRLYKNYDRRVKWVIILQPYTSSIYDKNIDLHKKGYKVTRWPEFLEYIGLDKNWDLDGWRKEYEDIRNSYIEDYERCLQIVKKNGIDPKMIISNLKKDDDKEDLRISKNNDEKEIDQEKEIEIKIVTLSTQNRKTKPSIIYKKICDEIIFQKEIDKKNISKIASKACLYGKDTSWLYFAVRNDMALGLLCCSDDNFCKAHQNFFPEMPKEMLLLRRRQATQWINDPNVFWNQARMLRNTTFEERYTMLVKNYLGRIDPVDPSQHTNNAFIFLQNFFDTDEQQILWHYLCNDLANKKQKAIERLSMVNVQFASFQTAKKNLSIVVEDPKYLDNESINPYNYLSNDVYFYVALFDTRDIDLCIKLRPDQAWLWETSIESIYNVAIQRLQDKREKGNDAELLVRRLLPQYFR